MSSATGIQGWPQEQMLLPSLQGLTNENTNIPEQLVFFRLTDTTTNTSLHKLMLKIMGEPKCHCSNRSGILCSGDTICIYSALCGKWRIWVVFLNEFRSTCAVTAAAGMGKWRLLVMAMAQENSKGAANTSEQLPTHSPACMCWAPGYGSSLINRPLILQFEEKKNAVFLFSAINFNNT